MTDDLIPVHVSVRHGRVSILMLLTTPVGTALVEGDTWHEIGYIHHINTGVVNGHGQTVVQPMWVWHYDEAEFDRGSGSEKTQKASIKALLAEGGYVEADDNAENQGLWSD